MSTGRSQRYLRWSDTGFPIRSSSRGAGFRTNSSPSGTTTGFPRFSDRSENLPQRSDDSTRTLIAEGYAFVRITNIDWIDRQGRIEIRLLDEDRSARLDLLLPEVLRIGFGQFNLHRLHGLVTPGPYDVAGCLLRHGFVCEATVPYGVRLAGRPRAREIWARLAEDWTECC